MTQTSPDSPLRTARLRGLLGLAPETLVFALLAALFLYPQSLAPATRIAYVGDSLESVAIVGFVGQQAVEAPARCVRGLPRG